MLKKGSKIASIAIAILCLGVLLSGGLLFMFISFFNFMTSSLFGGTLFPKNYSKKQVNQLIKTVVPDSNYIKSKKVKKVAQNDFLRNDYYLYEDSYGREFIIESTSIEGSLLYGPKVFNGYECCILQKNIEEIKTVLNDTGLKYSIMGDASKMQDDNMLKWATETPSIAPMDFGFYYVKEEDMMLVANTMAKIDGILKYNYNKKCTSGLKFETYDNDNVFIYFKDLKSRSMASFKLSTCESERWTADSIYECIQKQFKQNITAIKIDEEKIEQEIEINNERVEKEKKEKQEQLEREIQRSILNYLEEKYDETFVIDAFSYFTINDTNDEIFFRLSCERLPLVRIEVTGTRNEDGTFDFTDDFEEGKKYKDNE